MTGSQSLLSSTASSASVLKFIFSCVLTFLNHIPLWSVLTRCSPIGCHPSQHGLPVQNPSCEEETFSSICGVSVVMIYCSYTCSTAWAGISILCCDRTWSSSSQLFLSYTLTLSQALCSCSQQVALHQDLA